MNQFVLEQVNWPKTVSKKLDFVERVLFVLSEFENGS